MTVTADISRPARPYHRFLWKGAGILALLFAAATVVPLVHPANNEPAAPQSLGGDFLVGYSAGTLAREGKFPELHDPDALMARIRAVAAANRLPAGGGNVGPWLNPPFFLWPFMALT